MTSILSLTIFLTLIIYFVVGIFKKEFFISIPVPGLSADHEKSHRTGWRAIMFGVAVILLTLFGLSAFSFAYNIIYTVYDFIFSLIIASLLIYSIKTAEKKLSTINPFKLLIPALLVIILIIYIVLIFLLIFK